MRWRGGWLIVVGLWQAVATAATPSVQIEVGDLGVYQDILPPCSAPQSAADATRWAQHWALRIDQQSPVPAVITPLWLRALDHADPAELSWEVSSTPSAERCLGVRVFYPWPQRARRIEWTRHANDAALWSVNLEHGREIYTTELTARAPTLLWEADAELHRAEAEPSGVAAQLRPLLLTIYRAYGLQDETQVYDTLSSAVDGALLETLYLDQRRRVYAAQQDPSVSRVRRIEVLSAQTLAPSTANTWTLDALWCAEGAVTHWGHSHARQRQYHARLTLTRHANAWRLSELNWQSSIPVTP